MTFKERREKELYDIHSSFRVLMHSEIGFPKAGETAGTMTERLLPHFKSFLFQDRQQLIDEVTGAAEEMVEFFEPVGNATPYVSLEKLSTYLTNLKKQL